jgi:glutaredoxin
LTAGAATGEIEVLVVGTDQCHFCHDADALLDGLAARFPLRVRRIEIASVEGMEVARSVRAPFPPVVLIDGRLFGYGRISARKLERHLERLSEGR